MSEKTNYPKTVHKRRLGSRVTALIVSMLMLMSCFGQLSVSADGEIVSTNLKVTNLQGDTLCDADPGTTEIPDNSSINTGEHFKINITGGFATGSGSQQLENVTLKLSGNGASGLSFPYFGQDGIYTADGVTYTKMSDDDGNIIIAVSGSPGETFVLPVTAYFNKGINSGTEITAELFAGNESRGTVSLTALADASMQNTNSAVTQSVILNNVSGSENISEDISFAVTAYSGAVLSAVDRELNNGEAYISSYTVTNTITLPEGMSFNVTGENDDEIKSSLKNLISFTSGETPRDITIDSYGADKRTVVFSYTVNHDGNYNSGKQISDLSGTVTIKSGGINVSEAFISSGQITSSVQTTYNIKDGNQNKTTDAVAAAVTVQRPTESEYSALTKEIEDVADPKNNYNTSYPAASYVLANDIIIYKISFKNSGQAQLTEGTVTDTLPDGLTAATVGELNAAKEYFEKYSTYNFKSNAWNDNSGATSNADGNTITFSNITLNGGDTFTGYVAVKVEEITDGASARTLTNTVKAGDLTYTHNVIQKAAKAQLSITKYAFNEAGASITSYNPGETVRYQINVSNSGNTAATGVTVSDYFPDDMIDFVSAKVDGTESSIIPDENGNYSWNNQIIDPGNVLVIEITGTVKQSALGNIVNVAEYQYGDNSGQAMNTLTRAEQPIDRVSITKSRTSESEYVRAGDEVHYRIAFTAPETFAETSPLIITDELPEWLSFVSATYSAPGNEDASANCVITTEPIASSGGTKLTATFTGRLIDSSSANLYGYIDIVCKVKSFAASLIGTEFRNRVTLSNGNSAEAERIVLSKTEAESSDGLTIVKTGYAAGADGSNIKWLTADDNTISSGQNVGFEVKITNTKTENYSGNITVTDKLSGNYSTSGNVTATVKEVADGVTGVSQNNKYSFDFDFTSQEDGSFSPSETPAKITLSGVNIPSGGYIVLSYSVSPSESFVNGSNGAAVNDSGYSTVNYKKISRLSVSKIAEQAEYIVDGTSGNKIEDVRIKYTVTVKNESTSPYITTDSYIIDELPEELCLAEKGTVTIDGQELTNASYYVGNSYDTSAWTKIEDNENIPEYGFVGVYAPMQISANGEAIVTYTAKLKSSAISELQSEIDQTNTYDFAPRMLTNNVIYYGSTVFELEKSASNIITTNYMAANSSVRLASKTPKPKIEKEAYAYFASNARAVTMGADGAEPGAYIVWRIKVTNDSNEENGETMNDYSIVDTLPSNYNYGGNSFGAAYPSTITDTNLQTGKIIKRLANGEVTQLGYDRPSTSGSTVTWNFNGEYALEPGESIEFTFYTYPSSNNSGVYKNIAEVKLNDTIYEAEDELELSSSDVFSVNAVKTSSTKEAEIAEDKSTVTYTLNVKNESTEETIKNLTIIDRLPFVGDIGVLTDGKRHSECDVEYVGDLSVKVGDRILESNEYTLSFSGNRSAVFSETDADWDGENGSVTWTDTAVNSTRLVRVCLDETDVLPGETVTVTFKGKAVTTDTNIESTVVNSFGYCYNSSTIENMAAEVPVAAVIKVEPEVQDKGTINITKQLVDGALVSRDFYFAVYDKEYSDSAKRIGDVKKLTLTGISSEKSVEATVSYYDLEYGEAIGVSRTYYVYETNAYGVPITQSLSDNGYNMYANGSLADEGSYCYAVVNLNLINKSAEVVFKNVYPVPTVEIIGPYIADVPEDFESAKELGDIFESGVVENGHLNVKDDNVDEDRNITDVIADGEVIGTTDGWGNAKGHTIATGFLAEITGAGTNTISSATWNITSTPTNGYTYMKLTDEEAEQMRSNGYYLNERFVLDDGSIIYQVMGSNFSMNFKVQTPNITLANGAQAYIGIIVDGIYDQGATAEFELNSEVSDAENSAAKENMQAANGDVVVNSPDQSGEFVQGKGELNR